MEDISIGKAVVLIFLLFTLGCSSKVRLSNSRSFNFTINNQPNDDYTLLIDSLYKKEVLLYKMLDSLTQKEYNSLLVKNHIARTDLVLNKDYLFKNSLNISNELKFITISDTSRAAPIYGFIETPNQYYKYIMNPKEGEIASVKNIENIEQNLFKDILNRFVLRENCLEDDIAILTELKKENNYWNVKITLGCSEKTKTD